MLNADNPNGSGRRRNLVIAVVGDYSCHPLWLDRQKQDFDLMLAYFGSEKDKYLHDARYYVETSGLYKLEGIHRALGQFPGILDDYDAVWMPDHDIITNASVINRLFELFYLYCLDLAQPSIRFGSFAGHPLTVQNPFCRYRVVNFVEMMCPIFTRQALREVLETFCLTRSGWGVDHVWPQKLKHGKLGIIDDVSVYHKVYPSMRSWSGERYYESLRSHHIDARRELEECINKYGLHFEKTEFSRISKPGWMFLVIFLRTTLSTVWIVLLSFFWAIRERRLKILLKKIKKIYGYKIIFRMKS